MMQEKVIKICKDCGVIQEKIQHGRFNVKDKRWRGIDNLLWNGNTCGICTRRKAREHQRRKRAAKKQGEQR